ncbi:MAG: hypothetical protein ACRDJE_03435, partial [Dehalococcoidia bacterium]
LQQIRIAGLRALRRELGPVGMVRFLHQYESGAGNYTEERRRWRDRWTMEEIVAELDERRQRAPAP